MTPLDAISKWLNEQDAEVRSDIGTLVSMLLFDNTSFEVLQNGAAEFVSLARNQRLAVLYRCRSSGRFRALFRICIRETLYTGGMDEHAKNVSFDYIHGERAIPRPMKQSFPPSAFPKLRALPERI